MPIVIPVFGPIRPVRLGDYYRCPFGLTCRSGENILAGGVIKVIDSTLTTPFGEIGPAGVNWVCESPNNVSTWATLEHCISRGIMVLVGP